MGSEVSWSELRGKVWAGPRGGQMVIAERAQENVQTDRDTFWIEP